MNVPRDSHNLVLLNNGKVLAIGGYKEQSCELFDPATETWTMIDSIPTFRYSGHTVTKLIDGRILVAGGMYVDTTSWEIVFLNNIDIYNPSTQKWVEGTPMNIKRSDHTATLLNDGKVLITGGWNNNLETDECEIYNPLNDSWSIVSHMLEKRESHAATLLNNGNVFVSGGNPIAPWLKSSEVYDVNTNQWFSSADMLAYRTNHKIFYLSKINKLLILGGDVLPPVPTTEDTWEIYNPDSLVPICKESFPINQFLIDNSVQLLNGNIFVAGNEEYEVPPGGLPFRWPSKRSWIFDVVTNVSEDNFRHIEDFRLEQSYPNPFNPATTISFYLPLGAEVLLEVYNVLGEKIKTLINEYRSVGRYTETFNGAGLPSGIYIYRLTSGNFTDSKKLILMK